MKGYVLCFILTFITLLLAEYFIKKGNKKIGIFILAISMFFLCFLAGVRDLSVGTDIRIYLSGLFRKSSQLGLIEYLNVCNIEYGFALLVYFSSLFKDIHFVFFVIQFMCLLPIYIYAYKKKNITMIVMIYLFSFYCLSLNLMRQAIAISFVILSYYYYNKNKKLKSFLLWLIAFSMHTSAIVEILIIFIDKIIKSPKNKKIYELIILIALIVFIVFSKQIISIIPDYSRYLTKENTITIMDFILSMSKKMIWIILAMITLGRIKETDKKTLIFGLYMLLVDAILFFANMSVPAFGRIGYYFLMLAYVTYIPIVCNIFKQKKIVNLLLLLLFVVFWWNMTAIPNNSSGVYPYISDLYSFLN